jgi:hypothetical protein
VKIPNSQKADHETPGLDQNGLVFKSPTTSIWVGSTGAGKTIAAANAIAHQAKWRKYDHIFLMRVRMWRRLSSSWEFINNCLSNRKWNFSPACMLIIDACTCLAGWPAGS